MHRAAVTTAATAAGLVLLLSLKPHSAPAVAAAVPAPSSTDPATGTGQSSSPNPSPSGGSSGSSSSDRTLTGSTAQTMYGPVQVAVVLKGGRVSEVKVLQYPDERQRDVEINSYALPVLNQEAVAAQSAEIDVVSGATYTSQGYIQSLQSALDQR